MQFAAKIQPKNYLTCKIQLESIKIKKKSSYLMDSPSNLPKNACRVCGDDGKHDLWETKFQYNDTDVMFIDAFNCFSELNNVRCL